MKTLHQMVEMHHLIRLHPRYHHRRLQIVLKLSTTRRSWVNFNQIVRFVSGFYVCKLLRTPCARKRFHRGSLDFVLQTCPTDYSDPATGPADALVTRRNPSTVPLVHLAAAPVSIAQDSTVQEVVAMLQHPTGQQWNDRDACIRELARAAEESTLLRQSLEHMTKACDSYQQQLQEILDQRNLLYRDYASAVLQMKSRHAALEQANMHLRQTNDEYREKIFSLETVRLQDDSESVHSNTAAEVVVLRHKLQRVRMFYFGMHQHVVGSSASSAELLLRLNE